jgi:hypothetical protein
MVRRLHRHRPMTVGVRKEPAEMKMPGFTAGMTLGPIASRYRARFDPRTSHGAVRPQMDAVVLDETYDEGGTTTHVTVTVSTPFDPDSVPEFFEAFGLSEKASRGEYIFSGPGKAGIGEGAGTYSMARRQKCIKQCAGVYEEKKRACAGESNPQACQASAYWEYWDCYGLCLPVS